MRSRICIIYMLICICNVQLDTIKTDKHFEASTIKSGKCKLRNGDEKPGNCVHHSECPNLIIDNITHPEICSFDALDPIICCESSADKIISIPGSKFEKLCNDTYLEYVINTALVDIIYGGVKASPLEMPHMAALGFGDVNDITFACGGSLISDRFVLTAAHCTHSRDLGDVEYVRLGDLNLKLNTDDAQPQNFIVKQTIRHPDYKPPSQYHDIALIELDRPIKHTDYVKPACLQTTRSIPKTPVWNGWLAAGWGNVDYGGQKSDHLLKVELKEFSNEQCREYYKDVSNRRLPLGIVDDFQLCAGGHKKDTCQGDSGGPLQIKNIFRNYIKGYTIIGVTSFGKACGITNTPGVYTRISHYIEWIENIVFKSDHLDFKYPDNKY